MGESTHINKVKKLKLKRKRKRSTEGRSTWQPEALRLTDMALVLGSMPEALRLTDMALSPSKLLTGVFIEV